MSLIFGDPCAAFYSTTAQAASGYWQSLTAVLHTSGLPAGNVGSSAMVIGTQAGRITVPTASGPYILGFRQCITSVLGEQIICTFNDESGNSQVAIFVEANGSITAWRAGTTLIATSSLAVPIVQNVWNYIEVQCSISSSVGTIGIRVNGTSVFQASNLNTKGSSSSSIGSVRIGSNLTAWYQDVVITDSNGSYNNTYLGDCSLSVYNSAGAGDSGINQYTANGAATVWQSVAAATPADSTVFASNANPGDRMSVTVAPTAVTGIIAGLIHVSRVQKDALGTRTFAQTITNNGHDQIDSTQSPGTTYGYFKQVSETDPNTGLPWTIAGFNTVQCGLETIA